MRLTRFKKFFCLLVLSCLGLKNASYALQPFGLVSKETTASQANNGGEDRSLLEIVADFVDLGFDTGAKDLSSFCMDKQRPVGQQFRVACLPRVSRCNVFVPRRAAVTYWKGRDRRFALPPQHSFLFRLTPF